MSDDELLLAGSYRRSDVDGYLDDLGAAAEEIGRLRWMLDQLIALADDAPELTDEQLRDRLLALADPRSPATGQPVGDLYRPRQCHPSLMGT